MNTCRPTQVAAAVMQMVDTIYQAIDVERVWRRIERIWKSDHWMTSRAWQRTARYVSQELTRSGASHVEIYPCPADGETVIYGQRMWPTWNVKDAALTMLSPSHQILCHYRTNPRSLMTHSAPTTSDGLITEIIRVDDGRREEDYRHLDVKGKIILTRQHGDEVACIAARVGVKGVVSDFLVSRDSPYLTSWLPKLTLPALLPDPPKWEQHMQWMHLFTVHEHGLFGFTLSPTEGAQLRQRLARNRVRVHAKVESRFASGTCPSVTGVIPGTSDEQVLVLSHLFEQGATDNASGCAVSLEIVASLHALISHGLLPSPHRSIRVFQGLEWQGIFAYLHAHQAQIPGTRAALCLDGLGQEAIVAQVPLLLYQNPLDKPTFTDPLIVWIMKQWIASNDESFPWMIRPYAGGTDNIIAEDPFNIPCPFLGGAIRQWHTTADTMEILSRRSLTHATVVAAAYCYFLASAGYNEAIWLVTLCEQYGQRLLIERATHIVNRRAVAKAIAQEAIRSVTRLQTIVPLVKEQEKRKLQNVIRAAESRLIRFAHMVSP